MEARTLWAPDYGYRKSRVIDNYISSVMKTEENMMSQWVDNRLTTACKYGFTLVYDEFTRSRPEANNILLTILEEKLLEMPKARGEEPYIQVHPGFRPYSPVILKNMLVSTSPRMP